MILSLLFGMQFIPKNPSKARRVYPIQVLLWRFSLYGFLKNQRYFEPFLMMAFLDRGLSYLWIGVLIACRDVTVNLLEIPSGAVADTLGRRGGMITSFVAYILSFLCLAWSPTWYWFFPAMVLYGIGDSFRTGTHKAMIFEWLRLQGREADRTQVYGYTRSWSKFGSAASGLIAAGCVLSSDSYRFVFVLAAFPYMLNIINFMTYPRELNGQGATNGAGSIRNILGRLVTVARKSLRRPALRQLICESMGWEGFFNAIKDYLQPVLAAFATMHLVQLIEEQTLSEVQSSALLIGPVYSVLFVFSAFASRMSHRVVRCAGSLGRASQFLWMANASVFTGLIVFDLCGAQLLVALSFVILHVLQSVWRPILISRFDDHTEPDHGATMLSIESQSQRLATLVVAPLLGLAIDYSTDANVLGQFWPIGLFGVLGCVIAQLGYVGLRVARATEGN